MNIVQHAAAKAETGTPDWHSNSAMKVGIKWKELK